LTRPTAASGYAASSDIASLIVHGDLAPGGIIEGLHDGFAPAFALSHRADQRTACKPSILAATCEVSRTVNRDDVPTSVSTDADWRKTKDGPNDTSRP
jgi:hypothetical protein